VAVDDEDAAVVWCPPHAATTGTAMKTIPTAQRIDLRATIRSLASAAGTRRYVLMASCMRPTIGACLAVRRYMLKPKAISQGQSRSLATRAELASRRLLIS
jgi:hypothetical protein